MRKNTTQDNRDRARLAQVVRAGGAVCSKCGLPIADGAAFDLDHIMPVATHPELRHEVSNHAPAHPSCNRRAGQALGQQRRKAGQVAVRVVPRVQRPQLGGQA